MLKYIKLCSLGALFLGAFASCDKDYDGDSYDFSNTTNPYIRLAATNKVIINADTLQIDSVVNGDTLKFYYHVPKDGALVIESRTAFADPTALTLEMKSAEGDTKTINATYDALLATKTIAVSGTPNDVNSNSDTLTGGTITLLNATNPQYGNLQIGYPEGSAIKVGYTYYKPHVRHEVQ